MTTTTDFICPKIRDYDYSVDSRADAALRRQAWGITLALSQLGSRTSVNASHRPALHSIGSQRIFYKCLLMFGRFLAVNRAGNLNRFPAEALEMFLFARSQRVAEAQLRADRWALQILTRTKLPWFPPARPQRLEPRAYTSQQLATIASHQTPPLAFSTAIATAAGLRCIELITIGRFGEQPIDSRPRPAFVHAFCPPGVLYSVRGKGNLIRSVHIPVPLVERLEAARRPAPVRVRHEGRDVWSFYDIPGGRQWAESFTAACRRAFGTTAGSHGVRHKYVKERIEWLQRCGVDEQSARAAVSVEIGHFRATIIDVYLRGYWTPMRRSS